MKKILLTLILSCITLLGFSQQRTITLKNFNTWGVTANVGMNTTDGDPSDEKTLFNTIKLEPSWGFSLTKQLSHFTGLEFSYNKGNTNTRLDSSDFSTSYKQFDVRFRVNLTNGQILTNYRNTQIFAYGGVGIINYTTTGPESFKEADWIHVVPVGFGAKHKLNDRFSLNLDFGYNFVNTDRFEGVVVRQSDEDGYWRTNLGLQYTIGSRKVLEWDRYTTYFTPSDEHSVDTVIVINKNIDTLFIKFMPDDSAMFSMRSSNKLTEDIVNFEFNKWDIKNKYFNTLDDLASKLNNGEIKSIVLDGHACEIGGEMNNLYVSKQRAVAIKNYLISKGVEESKVLVRFYGERMPISDEKEINRRVEIKTE
jgi:outer membrane protein OmpA-like peptidoglycan-associated protein